MPQTFIHAALALTPLEEIADTAIIIEDGRIISVGRRDSVTVPKGAIEYDARAYTVVPGFVDVHIHGAGSRDVMEASVPSHKRLHVTAPQLWSRLPSPRQPMKSAKASRVSHATFRALKIRARAPERTPHR